MAEASYPAAVTAGGVAAFGSPGARDSGVWAVATPVVGSTEKFSPVLTTTRIWSKAGLKSIPTPSVRATPKALGAPTGVAVALRSVPRVGSSVNVIV